MGTGFFLVGLAFCCGVGGSGARSGVDGSVVGRGGHESGCWVGAGAALNWMGGVETFCFFVWGNIGSRIVCSSVFLVAANYYLVTMIGLALVLHKWDLGAIDTFGTKPPQEIFSKPGNREHNRIFR